MLELSKKSYTVRHKGKSIIDFPEEYVLLEPVLVPHMILLLKLVQLKSETIGLQKNFNLL